MNKTLSGKEPAEELLMGVKERAVKLKPKFAIVLVGKDSASQLYVSMKIKKAEAAGIETELHELPDGIDEKELLALVEKLNKDKSINGFIVQAPLPKHIDSLKVMEMIKPEKDVDGWTSTNMGKMFIGEKAFLPATPAGVMKVLEYYKVPLEGKHAVVIGRSTVVGRPLAILLLKKNATVTICHSKTENLSEFTKTADILISAVGQPGLVKGDMVKEGATVIDVGTTKVDGETKGDIEFDEVIKKADCSPVPGGVGPMTVAMLLNNVVEAAERL